MRISKIAMAAMGAALLVAGCGQRVPEAQESLESLAPSSPALPQVSSAPSARSNHLEPGGLLVAIIASQHPGHDRLVFEFGGTEAPAHRIHYVSEVHADPSDRVIPLLGSAFLEVVLDGGTLDTSPREADPSQAQRYKGPTRITPGLPLIKDLAVAGDFEGVLIFGVGLARPAGFHVERLTSPARVVIDIWYDPASAPPSTK